MQACLPERLISLDCLHSTGDCFLTASSFLAISNLFIFYSTVAEKKFHHVVILTCIPLIIVKLSISLVYWPLYAFILLKITYLSLLPIFLFKLLPVLLTYKIFLYCKDMFLTLQHPCLCAFQTCLKCCHANYEDDDDDDDFFVVKPIQFFLHVALGPNYKNPSPPPKIQNDFSIFPVVIIWSYFSHLNI